MSKSTKPPAKSKPAEKKQPPVPNLIIRPWQGALQNVSKAYIHLDTLKSANIEAGSYISIGSSIQGHKITAIATPGDVESDCIHLSSSIRDLAQVFPGDRIDLIKANKPAPASKISVQTADSTNLEAIKQIVVAHPNQKVDNMVITADDTCLITPTTEIETLDPQRSANAAQSAFSQIGGLDKELDTLRALVELPLKHPDYFQRFNTDPERGVLLYGPPGTGKTMLLKAIANESENVHILRLNGPAVYSKYLGEAESKLRDLFLEAERFAPSIIFVDEIDALAPKRDSDDSGETESRVVSTLLTLMDGMKRGGRVVVIGATNRPNQLDSALRRPGRLGQELEIGTPDQHGRLQILNLMLQSMPNHLTPGDVNELASKTHGYVGADLQALLREAVVRVVRKCLQQNMGPEEAFLKRHDLEAAMLTVTPSAMREISLELPKVHWADIGGQDSVIQRLRETVEWPLQRSSTFERLGVNPPRGVLLYGPPGCSKTLLAKALATEAGLNFLAVKGPELFNKYVGESERALRAVFQKARQASPSIIFFDEIDALSVSRGDGEAGGDRVLTSLLNEMDGIETLNGVVVLAATNRPDVIDAALMRPGRLDRLIYVSPPNFDARRQILLIQLAKMAISDDVELQKLAEISDGFSGAELISMCQEAGLLAMNESEDVEFIMQKHFEEAAKGIRKTITPSMIDFYEKFAGLKL